MGKKTQLYHNKAINIGILLITFLITSSASTALATDYLIYADSPHVPTPSTPQFTIEYVDYSHDVAPTTTSTTNPYNGNTTTITTPGYHVNDFRIEMKIKNKIYSTNIDGKTYRLYYYIQSKGFYEPWSNTSGQINTDNFETPSTTEYTTLSWNARYQPGDKIDYRVQAFIGTFEQQWNMDHMFPIPDGSIFIYRSSGWSQTQTFTMPDINTPITNPTETPTEPVTQVDALALSQEQTIITLIGIPIIALAVGFTIYYKKTISRRVT